MERLRGEAARLLQERTQIQQNLKSQSLRAASHPATHLSAYV